MAQILTSPMPPLREFRPDADVRLEAICLQAMAKEISVRPASMAIFASQLAEYQRMADGKPAVVMFAPAARKPSKPSTPFGNFDDTSAKKRPRETKPTRWAMIVGAAVFGLLVVAVILLTAQTKRSDGVAAAPDKTVEEVVLKTEKPTVSAPVVAVVDLSVRKGGDEISFEIADGVKMAFCWIPKGKATLGSPESEKNRSDDEKEHEFATDGFWLAKTECTQSQWESVMGENPSYFCASGNGKANVQGMATGNFPVEKVSWDDTQLFLKKLNARGGMAKSFGKAGAFKLPHEDQWEYAYRCGKGNKQAFYWGDVLNGDKANTDGNSPHGTETKGAYLERTSAVGSYARSAPHAWGLSDMSGNVREWCNNLHSSEQESRVLRGGSWYGRAAGCRAADRSWLGPAQRYSRVGFRVCLD